MDKEFSPEIFKHWMMEQQMPSQMDRKNHLIGIVVDSKLAESRIKKKMCVQDGALYELASDFIHKGGTIIEVDGKNFLIEVYSGTFSVPRQYVRKRT